jgi:excisionase family DNA binding protein
MTGYNAAVPAVPKLLYTVNEAAEILSISRRTVFRLIADGELTTKPVRGTRRIPYSSMQEYALRDLDTASLADSQR